MNAFQLAQRKTGETQSHKDRAHKLLAVAAALKMSADKCKQVSKN